MDEIDETEQRIAGLDQSYFRDSALIRLRSLSDFALSVWKGLMIVNGGAIVALFTLLGNSAIDVNPKLIWYAFFAFSGGIASTIASNLIAYVTQSAYFQQDMSQTWDAQELMHGRARRWQKDVDRGSKIGSITEWAALIAAGVGLLGFLTGAVFALRAVVPVEPDRAAVVRPALAPPPDTPSALHRSPPSRTP